MSTNVATAVRDEKGLKTGAIGVVSATVIGVASTAPAYSAACTLGLVAAVVGFASPAIMLVAFFPMLFTAAAYYYLNRVDPDCGATFSWVTRAMGPNAGWLGGWGVIVADIVVMPSLAWIAAFYTYSLFGLDSLAEDPWALLGLGVVFILGMTLITWIGIELSARTQFALLAIEVTLLVGFSIWAIAKVYLDHPPGSTPLSWQWVNPFNLSATELSQGVLLALFIYWGWDSAANVNEETRDARSASGIATVLSTIILVGTYIVVAYAATAYKGPGFLSENPDDVLTSMVGGWQGKLLMIAVLTSAMASTQTTILPTARTTLSMAAHGALPKSLAKIHPRFLTPTWSTWWFGIASVIWWVILVLIDSSENILWDSITGLGFAIAFYIGLTALAAPILFRKHLFKSVKNLVLVGIVPLTGFAVLAWVFVRSAIDTIFWSEDTAYTPAWFAVGAFRGFGAPFVIGFGMLVIGIPLWLWARRAYPAFFARKSEAAESLTELLPDEVRVTDEALDLGEFEPPPVPALRTSTDGEKEEVP
jgi:amino acid transporter